MDIYCNRIVSKWNTLPQGVVNSSTMLAFKRHLQSLTFLLVGGVFLVLCNLTPQYLLYIFI